MLTLLKRAYGAAVPPNGLPCTLLPPVDSAQFQDELVTDLLLAPHFQDYPPSHGFRRLFWKWVVNTLEACDEEVDQRIYEACVDLLSTKTSSLALRPPSPSYITHFWSLNPACVLNSDNMKLTTLLESHTMIEAGTTGLRTWNASFKFADWLVSHSEVVQERKVLELGSGAGFLGLIIAALQIEHHPDQSACPRPPSLVLTDVHSEVLLRCRQNFQLPCNGLRAHPSLEFRFLDWSDALNIEGNSHTALKDTLREADIIVGADLVYDVTIIPALVAVLVAFFDAKDSLAPVSQYGNSQLPCAYIALTIRREHTVSVFLSVLLSHHLTYNEIDLGGSALMQFLVRAESDAQNHVKLVRVTRSR